MAESLTSSPSAQAASGVCSALHRAYRDLRLYPPNHPMPRQSIAGLTTTVGRYLEEWGTLCFEVREDALFVEGESVYRHDAGHDNLAFLLFRDGVRTLSLLPGVDTEEIESLVDCLAHADDLADMEQDMVTALWERDLGSIDYQVVDPFLTGEVLGEGMVDALRERVLQRLEDTEPAVLSAGNPDIPSAGRVEPTRLDAAALRLSPQEIQAGEQALQGLSSVLRDFAEVLLEMVSGMRTGPIEQILARSVSGVVSAFLDADDVAGASLVMERLRQLETQGAGPAGLVGVVARDAVGADHLRKLLERAAQSSAVDVRVEEDFVRSLAGWIAPGLLELLAETNDRDVRRTVLGMLGGEGGVPWPALEPLLRDPRWYAVRNGVQLAAAAQHAQLLDHVPRLLRHPDVRVRREVMRAVQRFEGQAATGALVHGLSDPDSSVRTLAVRAAAREGGPRVEGLLLARIEQRDFASLAPEELEAVFGAYAQVVQERALPVLERWWKRRLFSPRPVNVRTAAVLAMGHIRGPAAQASLLEASRSAEQSIKRAAAQAIQMRASFSTGGE